MMRTASRVVVAIVAGLATAFALVVAVELFSAVVHPTPPGFTGTQEEMCEHVARYPHWVLAVVVVLWSATGFIGTWIAARMAAFAAGLAVGSVLFLALVANVVMLPYPLWFKIVMPVCFAATCWWGANVASRVGQMPYVGPTP